MTHAFPAFAAALLLTACATTDSPDVGAPPGDTAHSDTAAAFVLPDGTTAPTDCRLLIQFMSYGAGIDGGARDTVVAFLDSDPAVRELQRHPWGREGEVTYCVLTASDRDATRLLLDIVPLVPDNPRGPVHARTRKGETFSRTN